MKHPLKFTLSRKGIFLLFFKGLKAPKYLKDRGLDSWGHFTMRPALGSNLPALVAKNGLAFLNLGAMVAPTGGGRGLRKSHLRC